MSVTGWAEYDLRMTVGKLDYPTVPGMLPKTGYSPAINAATYPTGTPLAATRVAGRKFNLIGRKLNGTDNSAIVYVGTTTTKPIPISPGNSGMVELNVGDDGYANLQDYYMTGTDGDAIQYIKVS